MRTSVDVDEIEVTGTEKLLAAVLLVFLLVGAIWGYVRLAEVDRAAARPAVEYLTSSERGDVRRADEARSRVGSTQAAAADALGRLELAREAYRTALDAGREAPDLEAAYRAAQAALVRAEAAGRLAADALAAAEPAADAALRRAGAEADDDARRGTLLVFALRLALVAALLAGSLALLVRLRRAASRFLPLGFAAVGCAALLALVLAGDYVTDYVDVVELGPLVLSLAGVALTLAAFWWLQRYLARRVPGRRVRRGECPFCGYPARGGTHCEGCGRTVLGECAACGGPRRVGTLHCSTCGAP